MSSLTGKTPVIGEPSTTKAVEQILLQYRTGERDFSEIDLREANLGGCDLTGANLSGANLEIANLGGANLSQTNLSGANLNVAKLHGVNLRWANLTEATLNVTNLVLADLRETILVQADLVRGELMRSDLSAADLTLANLSGSDLQEAQLRSTCLAQCNLEGANLTTAILESANLQGANLHSAVLDQAILLGANLQGVNLIHANLSGANLSCADLRGANLRWADLTGANLRWADLTGAKLSGATLAKADLTKAILRESSLIQADCTETILIKADWSGANLSGINLTGARLHGVSRFGLRQVEEVKCRWVDLSSKGDLSLTRSLNPGQAQLFFREGMPGVELTIDSPLDYYANFMLASLYHRLMQNYSYLRFPPSITVMPHRTQLSFQLQQERQLFALAYLIIFPFAEAEKMRQNLLTLIQQLEAELAESTDPMMMEIVQQVKSALDPLVGKVKPLTVPYPEQRDNFFAMPIQVALVNSNKQSLVVHRSASFGKRMAGLSTDRPELLSRSMANAATVTDTVEQALEFLAGFYQFG